MMSKGHLLESQNFRNGKAYKKSYINIPFSSQVRKSKYRENWTE